MQKMSEKEAIEMLKAKLTCMKLEALSCIEKGCDKDCDNCQYNYAQGTVGEQEEALEVAIQALEEVQQHRAIGTLDQCREAVERMKPKKVIIKPWCAAKCPTCGKCLSTNEGDGYYSHWTHIERCPNAECSQRLLWEE